MDDYGPVKGGGYEGGVRVGMRWREQAGLDLVGESEMAAAAEAEEDGLEE